MKKNIIIISVILLILITISFVGISINAKKISLQKLENKEYEQFLDKDIYGTDVATLINKAIDNNNRNNIEKDKNSNYIENDNNSIIIELIMITDEEKQETTTYRMETIDKVGMTEFISNFNTEKFKITNIEYHKQTGKIKSIQITEQYG